MYTSHHLSPGVLDIKSSEVGVVVLSPSTMVNNLRVHDCAGYDTKLWSTHEEMNEL